MEFMTISSGSFNKKNLLVKKIPMGTNHHSAYLYFRAPIRTFTTETTCFSTTNSKLYGCRVQVFRIKLHKSSNLLNAFPYLKYPTPLLLDQHFQVYILEDELKLLFQKLKELNKDFQKETKILSLEALKLSELQVFNGKLEELLGLLREIFKSILFGKF